MDLLMASDVYFPRVNGVSTSIPPPGRALVGRGQRARRGAPYSVGAPAYQPRARDAEFGDAFQVIRLPARVLFFDPEDRLFEGRALREACARLSLRRWDAVHIHTPFRAHSMGVRVARACGAPVVETYHTYFEEYVAHYLPWLPGPVLRLFARRLSRKLCHEVDHLLVPTAEMTEVLARYGIRTPSTVMPTGIDLDEFAGGDGARFRAAHGIDANAPVVATVSRLAIEKNIPFLLEVVQRLVQEFPALRFVIAGEGPDAKRLRALSRSLGVEAHVLFVGNLDRRTHLLDCYRAADVFLFASPTETQGLVLIEAMALGVPIVSTAVMGTATVLRDAGGAVVSEEEVASFAGHVAQVLRDAGLRATLSAAGRDDARRWSNDRLIQRLLEVYADTRPTVGARSTPLQERA